MADKTYPITVEADNLNRIGAEVRRKLAEAVKRAAFAVEADAKQRAPVDTGNLRGSIQADVDEADSHLRATVDVGAEYGGFVEMGTATTRPQPFLSPAVDAQAGKFERDVRRALDEGLRDES